MAIRDRVRRALRRSDSSSDTSSQSDSNTASSTANTSQSSETAGLSLQKTSSKLSRTFTFGSRGDKEKKEKKKRRPMHPSEKPLTVQNLRHQEMLGHFTMTFGTNNLSQIELPDFNGVSPCCTRAPSIADFSIEHSDVDDASRSLTDSPSCGSRSE